MKTIIGLLVLTAVSAAAAFGTWKTHTARVPPSASRRCTAAGWTHRQLHGHAAAARGGGHRRPGAGPHHLHRQGPEHPVRHRGLGFGGGGPVLDKDGKLVKLGTILLTWPRSTPACTRRRRSSSARGRRGVGPGGPLVKSTPPLNRHPDWGRAERLFKTGGVAKAEYDQYKAAFGVATANLGSEQGQRRLARPT